MVAAPAETAAGSVGPATKLPQLTTMDDALVAAVAVGVHEAAVAVVAAVGQYVNSPAARWPSSMMAQPSVRRLRPAVETESRAAPLRHRRAPL